MEIRPKINTKLILRILHVIPWALFAGLGIDAGGYISNMIWKLAFNPEHAKNFWGWIDFSSLYLYSPNHFFTETLVMSILAAMKAWMFSS